MVKLFVAGIPDNLEEIGLIGMFSLYAMVSSIRLVTDKQSGKCLGYGFIEVQDMAAASRTIEAMNGLKIGGRKLEVKIAEERNKPVVKTHRNKSVSKTPSIPKNNEPAPSTSTTSKRPRIKID